MGVQTAFSIRKLRQAGIEVEVKEGEAVFDYRAAIDAGYDQDSIDDAASNPHFWVKPVYATIKSPGGNMTGYPLRSEVDDEIVFDTKHRDPGSIQYRLLRLFKKHNIDWDTCLVWEG